MTYFPRSSSFPGAFFVSAINGVEGISGETYWELIEHSTGKQYDVGESNKDIMFHHFYV